MIKVSHVPRVCVACLIIIVITKATKSKNFFPSLKNIIDDKDTHTCVFAFPTKKMKNQIFRLNNNYKRQLTLNKRSSNIGELIIAVDMFAEQQNKVSIV